MTLTVLEACRTVSARVPEDVAVIGVDNDEIICELANPCLTSVDQGALRIGYESARLLDRLMSGKKVARGKDIVPPSEIISRRSTDTLAVDDPEVLISLKMIRNDSSNELRIQDVLDAVAVSRSTLESRFKARVGRTMHEEIQRQRIGKAKFLIASTEMPIKYVAHEVGFSVATTNQPIFAKSLELAFKSPML